MSEFNKRVDKAITQVENWFSHVDGTLAPTRNEIGGLLVMAFEIIKDDVATSHKEFDVEGIPSAEELLEGYGDGE